MVFLAQRGVGAQVARAVLRQAVTDSEAERSAYFRGVAAAVQNGVARAFGARS